MSTGTDPQLELIIEKCIEDIWKHYDNDNSGYLDKRETKEFVKNTLIGVRPQTFLIFDIVT